MLPNNENPILKLTFQFSLALIVYTELLESKRKFNLSNQLFRSGTSIGANVKEAQNAESKADFIHKMKIAAKEAEELEFYFEVCNASPSLPDCVHLSEKTESICKVLSKIISTSKAITN